MNYQNLRRLLIALTLLCVGASQASASTVVTFYINIFGAPLGTSASPANPTIYSSMPTATLVAGNTSSYFEIPLLNPFGATTSLGIAAPAAGYMYAMSAVNLTLDWTTQGTVKVINGSCDSNIDSSTPCQNIGFDGASAMTTVNLSVDGTNVNTAASAATGAGIAFDAPGGGSKANSFTVGPTSGNTGNSVVADNAFEGMGTITALSSLGRTAFSGSSSDLNADDLSYGGTASTGDILKVTYTFDQVAVPEPVTMVLTGSSSGWRSLSAASARRLNRHHSSFKRPGGFSPPGLFDFGVALMCG